MGDVKPAGFIERERYIYGWSFFSSSVDGGGGAVIRTAEGFRDRGVGRNYVSAPAYGWMNGWMDGYGGGGVNSQSGGGGGGPFSSPLANRLNFCRATAANSLARVTFDVYTHNRRTQNSLPTRIF